MLMIQKIHILSKKGHACTIAPESETSSSVRFILYITRTGLR